MICLDILVQGNNAGAMFDSHDATSESTPFRPVPKLPEVALRHLPTSVSATCF